MRARARLRTCHLWALFVAPLALALAGCPKRILPPTFALDESATRLERGDADARAWALAGFRAWLVEGDALKAQERFDEALKRNEAEPYALYGQMVMASRRAHPERAVEAALALCRLASTHPLSTAAARYVLDFTGTAPTLDERILKGAESALSAGAQGDAAHLLRSALASVHMNRLDDEAVEQTVSAMGVPVRWAVVGPLSPFHLLSFDEPLGPERDGSFAGPFEGPFGRLEVRQLDFPDGRFTLSGEPPQGDGYVAGVDIDVPEQALYVVRSVTAAPHKVYLDGTLLFERRSFERSESTVSARAVRLSRGRHRLWVRLQKDEGGGAMSLSVMRADGSPAGLSFTPAQGPGPSDAAAEPDEARLTFPDAKDLFEALRDEASEVLAAYVAARDGMGRDRDGARALVAQLARVLSTPAVLALRAEVMVNDRSVPPKVAIGRATRDIEATLEKDPKDVRTRLLSAQVALDDGRLFEAAEAAKLASASYAPPGYPVALLQAKVELALGVDAQADARAREALERLGGLCEAVALRYDVARRRDAAAGSDELLEQLKGCPNWLARKAEHARARGNLEAAVGAYRRLLAKEPTRVSTAHTLSSLYVAQRRFDEAATLLERLSASWPRNATIAKELGELYALAGQTEKALEARERALSLDGGDLELRRIVERAKTGRELLEDAAIDGKKAIAAYEAGPGPEDTVSVYVLDAAAVRAWPDGSSVDRIHIVQKALDQSGVADVAEVDIPAGAYVLALRTIKADGTVLEPESIEGKDTISLPGVQVGDYVEYEYLLAQPSRGPKQPGFTAPSFYFQVARQPNSWSTYKVMAPAGSGLEVDAHNMKVPPVRREGDLEVFFHEERQVPPYIPEPNGPPSANEYLPFVIVGSGARGNEGLVAAYADAYFDRGQRTFEVSEFARNAAQGKTGLEAVRAVYAAVMDKLKGRDEGLTSSASASAAQDRGSRLWLLKAALESLGIPARIAAVRPFAADPAPYRFPNEGLLSYLCVVVEVDGRQIWLDPSVRFAPFGELPEQAAGGREAYLMPEPGRPLAKVRTPDGPMREGKRVTLSLELHEDGRLTGSGEEEYVGFEAAQLAEALEALSPDQRDQALQSALTRYFGGAELSRVELSVKRQVGAPLVVRYRFSAPHFARREGQRLVLGPLTFPTQLGRRYVQLGSRRTPLYIDSTESSRIVATLKLPAGFRLSAPLPEMTAQSPFGRFSRREREENGHVIVDEELRLDMARIAPKDYDAFARFAGEVDLAQARELVVEHRQPAAPKAAAVERSRPR